MADLEDLGFLEQPHTSAGRIPSAKGYRFYVDAMLHSNGTEREDAEKINKIWQEKPANFEDFFLNVAKLISQISHNMSLFLAPAHDTSVLKFIHVLPIGENRAIMVVVTDQGALDNEPMYFKEAVADDVLASMAIRMTNALKDVRLSSMTLQNLEATVQLIEGPRAVLLILQRLCIAPLPNVNCSTRLVRLSCWNNRNSRTSRRFNRFCRCWKNKIN